MRLRLVVSPLWTVVLLTLLCVMSARASTQSRTSSASHAPTTPATPPRTRPAGPTRVEELVEDPGPPAWRVHAAALARAAQRLKEIEGDRPRRRDRSASSDFDGLTAAQVEERIAPARQALEADLRQPMSSPHPAYRTLEALASIRTAAAPAVPTIIALLDRWNDSEGGRIPYVCASLRALTRIAPQSPEVIAAASQVIASQLPARGVCHVCGCALDLLTVSGPAARDLAGPVLQKATADPHFITTYDFQLGRALKAVGLSSTGQTAQAVARALNPQVLPGSRAEVLRALAEHAAATPADRASIRDAATALLGDDLTQIRVAAAGALGATGPEAVSALTRAMGDWSFDVRAAAASSLARLGAAARPAAATLAASLDPFMGTAAQAGAALIAIGPPALPAVEARLAASTVPQEKLVLNAVARSLREGRDLLTPVLQRDLPRGAFDKGYLLVEPWQTATPRAIPASASASSGARSASAPSPTSAAVATLGRTPYIPDTHRITLRYSVLPYGTPTRMPPDMGEQRVVAWQAVNPGIAALAGHRAGERLRVLMSADIAQSLMYGTAQHQRSYGTHVSGTPGHFDVTIERVCEPQIWTLFRGGGIFGPLKIETSCRD